MAGDLEHFDEIAERDVLLHGDDIGARHHDALDPGFPQAENIFQHGGFFGRESRLRLLGGQDEFEIGARRCRLPAEQDAHDARQPAFRLLARFGHHHRQPAMLVVGRFGAVWGLSHGGISASAHRVGFQDLSGRLGVTFRGAVSSVVLGRYGSGIASRRRIWRSVRSISSASLVPFVVVADQMQEPVHGKMGEMMGERLALGSAPRARWFQRRERCRRDGRRRRFSPEMTGRSWPRRCPASPG